MKHIVIPTRGVPSFMRRCAAPGRCTWQRHSINHLFEWMVTGAMIWGAITVIVSPDAQELVTVRSIGPDLVLAAFFVATIIRLPALILTNIYPDPAAWGRIAAGAVSASVWLIMALGLIRIDFAAGHWSVGWLYLWIAMGEILSVWRASLDVGAS